MQDFLSSVNCSPPLTRRGLERRLALLSTAHEMFLHHGYDHVSLDDIVQAAGGSKTSIYKYFGDKERLFHAVCEYHLVKKLKTINVSYQHGQDLAEYFHYILTQHYYNLRQAENILFLHVVLEQTKRKPDSLSYLNQKWRNDIQKNIEDALDYGHQQQLLNCENARFSTMMFWGILHDVHWKAIFGTPIDQEVHIEQYIQYSVQLFLNAHRYKPILSF